MKKVVSIIGMFLICSALVAQGEVNTRVYEVWDDQPAPNRGKDYSWIQSRGYPADPDWEAHSYPIGNGYMGANIFGRTDMERIQITDKTLTNGAPYGSGGMTNFAEIFLEFDHYEVSNYKRSLNLNEGISRVSYEHKGVRFTREYFASYPSNVIAIRLSAGEKEKLSLTVSAVVPYLRSDHAYSERIKLAKYAAVEAHENSIIFSGTVPSFSLNYEGQIRIINEGGKLIPNNKNGSNEIRIVDANSAMILIATGTNYRLSDQIFLTDSTQLKLDPDEFPHKEVTKTIEKASNLGYEKLKESHLTDYQNLFSRVKLELSPAVSQVPTKTLVENYKQDASDVYLEELMFHFGRYLLIASSREGTLPSGLQGVWSQYHVTPWSGGYWHNINVQMNYWGAFSANLPETFVAYEEYFNAYLPKAYENGREYIKKWHPDVLSYKDKGNGWCIGTGANAYHIGSPGGHSGPGTGGFTTKLFWDRFAFTQDTTFLRETAYPALLGMSTFLSRTLVPSEEEILLVDRSASPEQRHEGVHYMTVGTTFDQGFVWETYNDLLKSANILKINDPFLETVSDQINKLDPILIGESGQVKEYREEEKYGDIGDPKHRHISHLCTIYPGTLINSEKPDWVKAASQTLDYRGNNTTGWAMAHRMNVRARTKEAEKAHEVYSKFLRERTLPNLWTVHPPFQIDGNLGTMAGVAEMLIQSHEGFIELLPALPKAWETGSFDGLVARGNFEIAASWKDENVTSFSIISGSGGECTLKYPDIEDAQITDANGGHVSFSKEGENLITFDTDKMGRYLVTLPVQVSGIYPHLAYYNNESECGTGAVVPWADRLWVITYGPHLPFGSSDKLYEITSELKQIVRPESIGGTPANRMIHKESDQLFIGPYAIDTNRNIRVIPYEEMPGRHTGNARHLSDPANKIYYGTMEEGFYEVNINTLEASLLYEDRNVTNRKEKEESANVPSALLEGAHGKGLYSGQGVMVFSNNGEAGRRALEQFDIEAGSLSEWDGKEWKLVRRNQFVEVTGPGGIYGNENFETDPIWAIGWDHKSIILGVRNPKTGWDFYRLPKASHTYDGAHGWNTEWPRIRNVGTETKPDYLMTMHGMFWQFPERFTAGHSAGIRPRSAYLKVIGDFARWNNHLVFGCDDSAEAEFLNKRKHKGGIEGPGQSNSNLWFTSFDKPDQLGPNTASGAVWLDEEVQAGEISEPFLFSGWPNRSVWIHNAGTEAVDFVLEVDKIGDQNWTELKTVQVEAGSSQFSEFNKNETGEWIRVRAAAPAIATVQFNYSDKDERPSAAAPIFNGMAVVEESNAQGGLLYALGDNRRALGVAAVQFENNKEIPSGYYELDEKLNLVKKEDSETENFIREKFTVPEDVIEIQESSVLIIDDKNRRWRLPLGNDKFRELTNAAQLRIAREVATERDLFNASGTFYELPAENADGFAKIRPVASHNFRVHDYASYRGMLVMTGIDPEAGTGDHIIRSEDGKASVWVGVIDDLWEMGKPVGQGGPWNDTNVKAGGPSDPYLIAFYDERSLEISHDASEPVTFRMEVEPIGHGPWMLYKEVTVKPNEKFTYLFPESFQPRWIRFVADKNCIATVWLDYN